MSLVTADKTRARMLTVREGKAAELLAWDSVAAKIGEAAGRGLGLAVFAPLPGVSIKGTDAAATLTAKLEATGFRCTWRDRRDPDDVPNHDLVVSWDGEGR